MYPRRIEIESEFDGIVTATGGQIVRSMLEKSPPFDNADYVFHEHKLIAELKCLERDKTGDPITQSKFRRLWIKWRQGGLVSGSTPRIINSRSLPAICQADMYEVMGKPIKRRIQKANKQIRDTKAALGLSDYRGVLFIANDGNFMFPPGGNDPRHSAVATTAFPGNQTLHILHCEHVLSSEGNQSPSPLLDFVRYGRRQNLTRGRSVFTALRTLDTPTRRNNGNSR